MYIESIGFNENSLQNFSRLPRLLLHDIKVGILWELHLKTIKGQREGKFSKNTVYEILIYLVPIGFTVPDSYRVKLFRLTEKIKSLKPNSTKREEILGECFFDLKTEVVFLREIITELQIKLRIAEEKLVKLKPNSKRSDRIHGAKVANLKRAKKMFSTKSKYKKSVSTSTNMKDIQKDIFQGNLNKKK